MNGMEMLGKITEKYPEKKPVAFNYAEARCLLLALAGRVANLEAQLLNDAHEVNVHGKIYGSLSRKI